MRPSLRFLALALVGWAGVRAATLDLLPGAEMFRVQRSEARPASIVATQFPPIAPVAEFAPPYPPGAIAGYAPMPQAIPYYIRPVVVPVHYAPAPRAFVQPAQMTSVLPDPAPVFYSPIPALDEWPLSRIAATSMPAWRPSAPAPLQSGSVGAANRIDRLQLTTWALLRGQQGQLLGPTSLANGGQLGGSQAGARLSYHATRQIALAVRTSSAVGRRGGEVAGGVRVQPVAGVPLWFTAERRQRLGQFGGGRNAFAVFAEAGLYQRPMPWSFQLDAYLQGGMVGVRSRDAFFDGGVALSRPLYRHISGGFGIWGGAQPGVYRLDGGPRITVPVRRTMRVHLDWRQRLAGNAQPGSGPALTLAGDF